MLKTVALSGLLFLSAQLFAQNKAFDKLEMYYSQGHYKLVYNRANRLLNTPDYDYSMLPSFYKAMAILQLAQNDNYYKKARYSIDEAAEMLYKVKNSPDGLKIFEAHADEIRNLKKDLGSWGEDVKLKGDEKKFQSISNVIVKLFDKVGEIPSVPVKKEEISEKEERFNKDISSQRQELLAYAKKFLGTPYQYGGTTPSGFDCSGFVGYVMNSQKISLPRRSQDQFDSSKKLKERTIQPGDLVFFSSGGGVTHVGIVYLIDGKSIYMIHASTGKGVEITEITNSSYWTKRIHGYGSYL